MQPGSGAEGGELLSTAQPGLCFSRPPVNPHCAKHLVLPGSKVLLVQKDETALHAEGGVLGGALVLPLLAACFAQMFPPPGKVQPSYLGEKVPVTLTSLPAAKAQRCWIQVRAGHRACTYQGPDEWSLHLWGGRLTKPFLGIGLAAGGRAGAHGCGTPLCPGGRPWSTQWPWGSRQAGPKKPVCKNPGLDRAFPPTSTLSKAHHPCPLCLLSKFSINQRVFGNFMSWKKRF